MEFNVTLLWPNINLEKKHNFRAVRADAIIWTFTIVGLNLTDYAIRGELYDLNISNRMANELGGAESAPEIVLVSASDDFSVFTATIVTNLTAAMQKYSEVEFTIVDPNGNKTTIMQDQVEMNYQRIIWENETQGVYGDDNENDGEDPLF